MIDIVGHVGYVLLVVGTYLVSRGKTCGWPLRAVGSATWVGVGVAMAMSSIWIWSTAFVTIDLVGWRRAWKKTDNS